MADVAETPAEEVPNPSPEAEATPEQEATAAAAPEPPPASEPIPEPTPEPMSIEEKWKADEDARMAQVNGASDPWNDPEPVRDAHNQ